MNTQQSFEAFGLPTLLVESLKKIHITTPTPVQAQSIAPGLSGKDILASAQTGTGKTIAFLMPVITKMLENPESTALILTPTRELAAQVRDFVVKLFNSSPPFRSALLIGGDPMIKQLMALKKNPRLIIGTPGRIVDHLERETLNLGSTKFLVLDETDRMLDMGFSEPLKRIVQMIPEERQTMMFSATMPPSIIEMSKRYLDNPIHIKVGSSIEPTAQVKQESVQVQHSDKFAHLMKELDIREGSVIVFVKTKHGADNLAKKLKSENHEAEAIHGDLKQRTRDRVILSFRNQKSRIMVATDVAARGLDVPHVMHVINYDLPQCPHDYIHRIGRTGRAGASGFALSMISSDDRSKWTAIRKLISGEDVDPQSGFAKSKKSSGPNRKKNDSRKSGSWGKKDFGDKREFGPRKEFGEKREFGDKREFGAKREFGDKREFGPRKEFGEKKDFGPRKEFGDKREFGPKKDFGDKKDFGPRKEFGGKKDFSSKKEFGSSGDFGIKKEFGPKKEFGAKKEFSSNGGFGPKKSFGNKSFGKKSGSGFSARNRAS